MEEDHKIRELAHMWWSGVIEADEIPKGKVTAAYQYFTTHVDEFKDTVIP